MAVTVGDRATGRDMRFLQPLYVYLAGDIVTSSNDVSTDVPGMAFALPADSSFLLDGYIAYTSSATAQIKLALTRAESGNTTGTRHGFLGVATTATTATGDLKAFRQGSVSRPSNVGFQSFAGGGTTTAMFCAPIGVLKCTDLPVLIQLQFCQAVSDPTATTIQAGSWMRLTRIPS